MEFDSSEVLEMYVQYLPSEYWEVGARVHTYICTKCTILLCIYLAPEEIKYLQMLSLVRALALTCVTDPVSMGKHSYERLSSGLAPIARITGPVSMD